MVVIRDDQGFNTEIYLFHDLSDLKREIDSLILTSLPSEKLYVCNVREIINILDEDDDDNNLWYCLEDGGLLEYIEEEDVYACIACDRYYFVEDLIDGNLENLIG